MKQLYQILAVNSPLSNEQAFNIDGDIHAVLATADDDTAQGTDVAIVATRGKGDMPDPGEDIVGRIDIDPIAIAGEDGEPGMRGISADQPRLAAWRLGFQISADIARGDTDRSTACDREMSKILAYAMARLERLVGRGE